MAMLQAGYRAMAADPMPVPPLPEVVPSGSPPGWETLEFKETIPLEWGTVFSIHRVEKGGESYTFWFLATDGTLRGVTTREFTGPNRGSFFPEVYVIRRK
jgi:hypothetical protein